MNATTPIQPFWQRLRDIAAYPFPGASLATIAVLVLVILLLGWLPAGGWLITLATIQGVTFYPLTRNVHAVVDDFGTLIPVE